MWYWYVLGVIVGLIGLFILYLLLIMVSSIFIKKKYYDKDSKYYRWLLNSITGVVLFLGGIRVHVTGMEKVPTNTKFLLVSNHRSKFDPITTWYVFRKTPIAFLSKIENFSVPWFGKIIRKCCFRDIDRENPVNAFKTICKCGDLMSQGVVNIGIYPEGTRCRTGDILPFHNGIFKCAQRAHAPIVVITVQGTEKIAHKKPFQKVHINMDVQEVLTTDFVDSHSSGEIGDYVRNLFIEKTVIRKECEEEKNE